MKLKKFNEMEIDKLKFSDIIYNGDREVFITLLYNDKNLKEFGIVKSKDVIGVMDETDTFVKGIRCHVSDYDYADIDFEEAEDLETTVAYDYSDGYTVFSNYEDALYFYEDNI